MGQDNGSSGSGRSRERKLTARDVSRAGGAAGILGGNKKARDVFEDFQRQEVGDGNEGRNIGRGVRAAIGAAVPGAGLIFAPGAIAEAFGAEPVSDFNFRDLSSSGQLSRNVRTSPARNVPTATTGNDRVDAGKVAKIVSAASGGRVESPAGANRRLRLQNARPRRSSLRIDFTARQTATRSGIAVSQ